MTINDYQIWLTFDAEKQKIQLPVNPETITVNCNAKNKSVTVAELGEVTIMQSRAAKTFAFSSFFPKTKFIDVKVKELTEPLDLIAKIEEWKDSKKPVHFIITSCKIDLFCTIEQFDYSEKGGDVGTIYYNITLKEYREITTRQVKVNTTTKAATVKQETKRVDNRSPAKTYTVVAGDCLWAIAQKQMGNGARYKELYEENKATLDPVNQKYGNPRYTIYAGQVLKIPS